MILKQIADNVKVREGLRVVEKYFFLLLCYPHSSNKFLCHQLSLPIPIISAIKNEGKKYGMIDTKKAIALTTKGESIVREELKLNNLIVNRYLEILEIQNVERLLDKLPILNDIYQNRPSVDVTMDQSKCTITTALKRVIYMIKVDGLINTNIACLGDDDLISVAYCVINEYLFNRTTYNSSVTIFEKDLRIINYIKSIAISKSLPIRCVNHSLEEKIALQYNHQFDCIFTDPPYTEEGLKLFLSRGIELLKNQVNLSIFLSYGHKPVDILYMNQKFITDSGLVIKNIQEKFNQYEGAQILGGISDFYHIITTIQTRSLISGLYIEKIYTKDKNPKNQYYQCLNCQKLYKVGNKESFKTIQQLKEHGCIVCLKTKFKLIKNKKKGNN